MKHLVRSQIISISSIFFLLGCKQQIKISKQKDKLVQISMSTNGRKKDTTGAFVIELNQNLKIEYYGGSQTDLVGTYFGEINENEWLQMDSLAKNKNIKDTILTQNTFEDTYFDLLVTFGNKKYYISGYYSHAPLEIKRICELIIHIKKKTELIKTSFTHSFSVKAYTVKRAINDSISYIIPKVE